MLEIKLTEEIEIDLGGCSIQKDNIKIINILKEFNTLKDQDKVEVLTYAINIFNDEIAKITINMVRP